MPPRDAIDCSKNENQAVGFTRRVGSKSQLIANEDHGIGVSKARNRSSTQVFHGSREFHIYINILQNTK